MELSLRHTASALLLGIACAQPSAAEPGFGTDVDQFCTLNMRTPPAPYSGDCAICHNAANKNLDRTPGFTAYKDHRQDGDFSYFCPAPDPTPNLPPVLVPVGNQLVSEQGLLELLLTASDPEGGAVFFEASGVPSDAQFQDNADGSASFVWMPGFDRAGNYPVLFKVTDAGNPPASASEDIIISVGNVNQPPVLDPIGNQSVMGGERLVLSLSATDPDRQPVVFSASGMPATAELVDLGNGTAEFRWLTEVAAAGNVAVTFIVSDMETPALSDEETIIITVGAVNRPPDLAPIGNQQVDAGAMLSLGITALDPDGDGLQFEMAGLPDGASFTDAGNGSASLSWVPRADQAGNHTLTCTVTDFGVPAESDAETFTISVGGVNRPPVLAPPVLTTTGALRVIALSATDPDANALRFDAGGVPVGATFVDNLDGTAEFRWEPVAGLIGDYTIVFTATDDGVPPESATAQSTISLAAPPPSRQERNAPLRCGIGFELVFVMPPLMWLHDIRRRRSRLGR